MKKIIGFFSLLVLNSAFGAFSVNRSYVEDEIIVKYKASFSSEMQKSYIERKGGKRLKRLSARGHNRVKFDKRKKIRDVIAEYQRDPNVEYAQPNYIYKSSEMPNDQFYGQLWGLKNSGQTIVSRNGPDAPISEHNPGTAGKDMDLENAWNVITNCSSTIVAVLDTGINYNHEDLVDNMWDGGALYPKHGFDFVLDANDPIDRHGHGTHVAGTIGAKGNNFVGTAGVCWNVQLMAVRVLDATGSGTTADIIQGIDFAADNGAKVINMSLGGGGSFDQAYSDAITRARTKGSLVVAAAGNETANNDSGTTPSYPCNFSHDNVICVAALAQDNSLASFSNFGTTSVDIAAPGVNITSTWPGTHLKTYDSLTSGWNFSTTSARNWGYLNYTLEDGQTSMLVNPPTWDGLTEKYDSNTEARVWKQFNLTGKNVAILNFYLVHDFAPNDETNLNIKSAGGDPFAPGGVKLGGAASDKGTGEFNIDISSYIGSTTSIGFDLLSNATGEATGTAVAYFNFETLTYNTNTYNVSSGTSMATPHIAGLAAMLFAFNPDYTYLDVANAINKGGVSVTELVTKTKYGKAASATGSLKYINTPTGGAAIKLP